MKGKNKKLTAAIQAARKRARLLSEELERSHSTSGLGVNVANAEFPLTIRYQGRSEIVYNQEALDDLIDYLVNNGVAYSLDSTSDIEPVQVPVGDEIEGMAEVRRIVRMVLLERNRRSSGTSEGH